MLIAFDYDETFTRDPEAWIAAMNEMKAAGHKIIGCTMRYEKEMFDVDPRYKDLCDEIYTSGRQAKRYYLASMGVFPNVWIDDTPEWISVNAQP